MSKVLILAGNISEPTFYGACTAAQFVVGSIGHLVIFDTLESSVHAENSQRSEKARAIFGPIGITTHLLDERTTQHVIPNVLADQLRLHSRDDLIVDLSSGQKVTASVLYAVSTISRIPNIYVLDIMERTATVTPENYGVAWRYTSIKPLKEIINITRTSHVELVYYRDRIEEIVDKIRTRNRPFAADTHDRLLQSLLDYFMDTALTENISGERFERCINGLGKICEDVAMYWYAFCQAKGLKTGNANNFHARTEAITSIWNNYRSQLSKNDAGFPDEDVRSTVLQTLATDKQLDAMKIYRNLASHRGRYYPCSRLDARLALDLTLMILDRVAATAIIDPISEI